MRQPSEPIKPGVHSAGISAPTIGGGFLTSRASRLSRFAASDDGTAVVYTSDDAGQVTIGGGVGKERNGVFFDCSKPASGTAGARLDGRSCWSK